MIQIERTDDYGKNFPSSPHATSPCVVCGRPVKDNPNTPMIHVTWRWEAITEAEYQAYVARGMESESQGCWPIGSDCLRRHPELKPYVNG